ncbi:phosphatase PAP2 family protein [Dolichospermum sp. ST_sed4]|nr:phosphatase PAP2 family protein [Dolichospermum sp. ST_sed4]
MTGLGIDTTIIVLLQSFRNSFFDFLSIFFAYTFSTTVLAIFTVILLAIFFIKKNKKIFLIPVALCVLTIIVKILKDVVARPRPEYMLQLPMLPYSQYSFPSGHTAAAFLLAVLLSKQYPKYKFLFYSIAILVGLSRIYLGLHYLSDVIASVLLGTLLGVLFVYKEKEVLDLGAKIINLVNPSQKI